MIIEIYRAVDAFLYLPTYVAEEYKIFETLFSKVSEKYSSIEVVFARNEKDMDGDAVAFNRMYNSNTKNDDTISIAICSPTILVSNDIDFEQAENCFVVCALIDKLPFWGINHANKEFETIEELSKNFKSVVYTNDNFKEGFSLGKKLKETKSIKKGFSVNFGEEIDVLEREYDKHEDPIAISADIVKIVKTIIRETNPLKINYRFSKHEKYLTTGLITHKKIAEKHPELISLIIEGIQKSITMFYSSDYIAKNICAKIAPVVNKNLVPTEQEVSLIVNMINSEKFYPADLNISRECWIEAVRNLSRIEMWTDKLKNNEDFILSSYNKFVENKFIMTSERSIARQFGIDLGTFFEEIEEEMKPLKNKLQKIEENFNNIRKKVGETFPVFLWIARNISSLLLKLTKIYMLIVIFVIAIISISIYLLKFVNETITMKDVYLSGIVGFIASTSSAVFILIIMRILRKKII